MSTNTSTKHNSCGCGPECASGASSAAITRGEGNESVRTAPREVYKPAVDIAESESAFVVHADLPGVSESDLSITYDDGTLRIVARIADRAKSTRRAVHSEYGVGDFERSFRIGEGVDVDAISASLRDGVLTLNIPKAEKAKARRIAVQTN